MSSQKTGDKSKTPKTPSKPELTSRELDKVVGGLKKNTGGRGKTEDPCAGGE